MPAEPPARSRNAAATRLAILRSARSAFARSGYDGVGVREIAKGAGVTAMLINRYFGSKEQLFAEVVADTMAEPVILTSQNLAAASLSESMAAAVVGLTTPGAAPLDGFMIMYHSAASSRAAEIAREQIERHHQGVMAQALSGDMAAERAALMLSVVAGVQVMRQMIGLSALAQADPEALQKLIAPLLAGLIEPPPPANESRP